MSVREIKVQLDTSQLDGRYAQYDFSCLDDEVYQTYYCKAEVDDKFYEMEKANLTNTTDIAYLQSELQSCKAELVVIQSKLTTLITKSTEENQFYSIFESVYKK